MVVINAKDINGEMQHPANLNVFQGSQGLSRVPQVGKKNLPQCSPVPPVNRVESVIEKGTEFIG